MPDRPQPSHIGDTHRIANALEALVELYALDLINQFWTSPVREQASLMIRLDGLLEHWEEARQNFYDPRVPSVKAEDHDG